MSDRPEDDRADELIEEANRAYDAGNQELAAQLTEEANHLLEEEGKDCKND